MTYNYYVGWDVSKATLNYCIYDKERTLVEEGVVVNQSSKIKTLLRSWTKRYNLKFEDFLHCMENTGLYCNPMRLLVNKLGIHLWIDDPYHLNRSMGRQKDKTDKVDARNIAEYCVCNSHKSKLYEQPKPLALHIDSLSKTRTKLVRYKQSMETSINEKSKFTLVKMDTQERKVIEGTIAHFTKQIEAIEKQIEKLIKSDKEAKRKMEIARSIPGIGPKNVIPILAITGLFEKVKTGKACASYAGISPHKYESGTSVKKRSRTSRAANKQLKTAFHQGAKFLLVRPSRYREIYDRLREKGLSYRQATNALRNRMITILYACLEKDELYDKNYQNRLA
jgi:transposase